MQKKSYYIINGITLYRLIAAPVLAILIIIGRADIFRWMLVLSFFTDAIDGYLARKYQVTSMAGAKLDSLADYLTIIVSVAGIIVFKPDFLKKEYIPILVVISMYLIQTILALVKYGKLSGFHTYAAKAASVLFVLFILSLFFFREQPSFLFPLTVLVACLELVEEIILVILLPQWKADVKGLYWVLKRNEPGK